MSLDPIQKAIDWQLRSMQLSLQPSSSSDANTVEDIMLFAIDEKYHHVYRRDYAIVERLSSGFTQEEVAGMFGLSQKAISKIRKKLQAEF